MTVIYTSQYSPVTARETNLDDGLSYRAIRDISEALNNYERYCAPGKLISELLIPMVTSEDTAVVTENIALMFAGRYLHDGYNKLRFNVGCERIAGSGDVTIRLRCTEYPYRAPKIVDTTYLSLGATVASMTCSSDTHDVKTATLSLPSGLNGTVRPKYYFLLTMQNASGSRAQVSSLDVTARYE